MLNNDEIWRDIRGFEGRYQVSSVGRVRSIQTNHGASCEHIKSAKPTGTVMYLYVKLYIKDVRYVRAVHRLVAEAFVSNPERKPMVNHIDGNKLNNCAGNLEWVTCSENHKHAFALGLRSAEHLTLRNLGKKVGSTSHYHNVSWDSTRNAWKVTVKNNGRCIAQKRFVSEVEAARYVNTILDKFGLYDRPRNIIEMPND